MVETTSIGGRRTFSNWACALVALVIAGSGSGVNAITIQASEETVTQGGLVSATVGVDDLNGAIVAGFDLLLSFDATIVEFVNVDFSDALDASDDDNPQLAVELRDAGVLSITGLSLFGTDFVNQDGTTPFTLFDLTFSGAAVGVSALTLAPNTLGSDVFFTDPSGGTFDESSINGAIEVTAGPPVDIPEPPAIALALGALLLLPTLRQRR